MLADREEKRPIGTGLSAEAECFDQFRPALSTTVEN